MSSKNKTLIIGIIIGMLAHYGYEQAMVNKTK